MTLLWAMITYLKSALMLFFEQSLNKYDLGLSNELLFIIIAQGIAKQHNSIGGCIWLQKTFPWFPFFFFGKIGKIQIRLGRIFPQTSKHNYWNKILFRWGSAVKWFPTKRFCPPIFGISPIPLAFYALFCACLAACLLWHDAGVKFLHFSLRFQG